MQIVKAVFLGIWLCSFGTLAYLYLSIYRRLPSGPGTVGVDVFAAVTTHNVFWWLGVAVCFGLGFVIVRAWPGRPIFWITLGLTELFPVGLLAMFLMLMSRLNAVR